MERSGPGVAGRGGDTLGVWATAAPGGQRPGINTHAPLRGRKERPGALPGGWGEPGGGYGEAGRAVPAAAERGRQSSGREPPYGRLPRARPSAAWSRPPARGAASGGEGRKLKRDGAVPVGCERSGGSAPGFSRSEFAARLRWRRGNFGRPRCRSEPRKAGGCGRGWRSPRGGPRVFAASVGAGAGGHPEHGWRPRCRGAVGSQRSPEQRQQQRRGFPGFSLFFFLIIF